jgi:hypothetical protein
MCHHTSEQIYEKLETVFQSYYSYLWMNIILTELYDVIQESVEKEIGKTVFNLGSCWLHILHDDFRDGCNAAKWNIEDSLSCLRWLFKDALARREDFTKVTGCAQLYPWNFREMFQLLREHSQYRLISRCMLMLLKLKQNY